MEQYTKFQIALQYFPDLIDRPKVATRRLSNWIRDDQRLSAALQETGYRKYNRHFTAHQVELIRQYIGDP